ncbi:MAG: DUF177 domain-containing protein [Chloroflexi bacterium]|nr:DUF177 domain-containing protein [Chloroflexota bacterium]
MRLNVISELRQAIGATTRYDLDEPRLHLDQDEFASVRGSLTLLRTDRGLLATVTGQAEVSVSCSRCLINAKNQVKIAFEEEYVPFTDPRTEARVQVETSEDFLRIDEEYRLDLSEGLRQYILTSGPSKPLCRTDCAGLCPECGADLNVKSCDCAKPTDSRWAALSSFESGNEGS